MQRQELIREFYENYDEQGRFDFRHGQVEFQTTMRLIEKYLKPGMRILEIGAGTGRYSHALAQKGYPVDAVELLNKHIREFTALTQPGETVTITQGDARNLPFSDETYDLTLLLGPMYHLFEEEDQLAALSEAIRVTKKGGVIFAAYCMADASIISYGFMQGKIRTVIEKKMLDPESFQVIAQNWDVFKLYRTDDIIALREKFAVTPLEFAAADGFANCMRETLAQMDEETFRLYLNYHFAVCTRKDLLGYSNHTLDIFRKD